MNDWTQYLNKCLQNGSEEREFLNTFQKMRTQGMSQNDIYTSLHNALITYRSQSLEPTDDSKIEILALSLLDRLSGFCSREHILFPDLP